MVSFFPFDMISPTLYDLIFGLPVVGPKLAGNPPSYALDFQLIVFTFSLYVPTNLREGEVTEHEHH